jgi:hypothetical protein
MQRALIGMDRHMEAGQAAGIRLEFNIITVRYQDRVLQQVCPYHFQLVGAEIVLDDGADIFQPIAKRRLNGPALNSPEKGVLLVAAAVPENVVFPCAEAILRVFLFHLFEPEDLFNILP